MNAEHAPKIPAARTGLFAMLSGLLPVRGSGAPSGARLALASLLATAGLLSMGASPAAAAGCPNESLREAQGEAGLALPDCRAYELASPPNLQKNGVDASGSTNQVAASPSGNSISYFSVIPFSSDVGSGSGKEPIYLSARSAAPPLWSTRGLLPLSGIGIPRIIGKTEDLARSIVQVGAVQPPLAPCEPAVRVCATPGHGSLYLEDNTTGAFQLIAPDLGESEAAFAAASADDTRILFQTAAPLLPEATLGVRNLYLWDESQPPAQRLSLVGLVPSSGASCSGLGCVAPASGSSAGIFGGYYQHTISADGTRAFFTDKGTLEEGTLYERLLDAGQTIRVSTGAATFREATPDGRYVFYTEAGGLYRFDTVAYEEAIQASKTEAEAFAAATTALAAPSAAVQGDLGVSTDGATAYFAATAALTGSEENEWGARAEEGELAGSKFVNVYRWHGGSTTFIATLRGAEPGRQHDEADWRNTPLLSVESGGPSGGERSSRLTPDGAVLVFASENRLTSYDNAGRTEFYRYDSSAPPGARLACLTCNPSGAPPTGFIHLSNSNGELTATPNSPNAFMTRNLSTDGSRLFFEAEEPLLPADVNGARDVYEWEAPGAGSCAESSPAFSSQDAGCLFLISSGTSPEPSYFGDSSASGEDVFFFTHQHLVSSDADQNADLYDARVGGGIAAQNPPSAALACETEACRPPASVPPSQSSGATEAFHGPEEGPRHPQPPHCRKGFVLRHGHCVKRSHRRHHRRAGRNGGGRK